MKLRRSLQLLLIIDDNLSLFQKRNTNKGIVILLILHHKSKTIEYVLLKSPKLDLICFELTSFEYTRLKIKVERKLKGNSVYYLHSFN